MDVRRVISPSQIEIENIPRTGVVVTTNPVIAHNAHEEDISAVNISIVSNSQLLREGLSTLLAPYLKIQLIATYSGEYHSDVQLLNPPGHMVLLDSSIGGRAAIEWIRQWRNQLPATHVFILELVNDIDLIVACVEAGAIGYTLQGASTAEVAKAIKDARKGKANSSPEVISRLFARLASLSAASKQRSTSILTDRESEIMRDIAAGYTNREIASHLVIELRTVKQHVHHILRKLNVHSRWEAARIAAQQGWIGYHLCLILALFSPSILDVITNGTFETICTLCEI